MSSGNRRRTSRGVSMFDDDDEELAKMEEKSGSDESGFSSDESSHHGEGKTGSEKDAMFDGSGFDTCFDDEEVSADPLELVFQNSVDFNVPPPSSTATKVKARVAEAGYLSEKLIYNKDAYDAEVFFMCQRYHQLHQQEHDALKKAHQRREEEALARLPPKQLFAIILNDPEKTTIGRYFAAFEFTLVLFSILQLALETLPLLNPNIDPGRATMWFYSEMFVTIVLSLESIARLLVSERKIDFFRSPYNWLDIIAILPFYLSFAFDHLDFLKILRTARFVKLMRKNRHIEALFITLRKIGRSLIAPFMLLALCVLLFSAAIFFVEEGSFNPSDDYLEGINIPNIPNDSTLILPRNKERFAMFRNASNLLNASKNESEWDTLTPAQQKFVIELKKNSTANRFLMEDCHCTSLPRYHLGLSQCPRIPSRFNSMWDSIYFTAVSMTTVGFGDIVPNCATGKLITSGGVFLSTIFLAMPIAIVGVSFTESVDEAKEAELTKKQENLRNIRRLRVEAELRGIRRAGQGKASVVSALRSGIGKLKSEKTKKKSSARSSNRQKQETPGTPSSTTAAESLLVYLAQALHCRYFNFSSPDGKMSSLADSPAVHGNLSPHVLHHIDAFFTWLFVWWVQHWHAQRKQVVTSRAKVPTQVDRTILALLQEQRNVLNLLAQMQWLGRLSFVESVGSDGTYRSNTARGIAKEIIFSRLVEYHIVAAEREQQQFGGPGKATPGASQSRAYRGDTGASKGGTLDASNATAARSVLHLDVPGLILPQDIATIQISVGFLSRAVRLVVTNPLAHQLLVNGKPIAPRVKEGDHAKKEKLTLTQILDEGDVIDFTPIVRVLPNVFPSEQFPRVLYRLEFAGNGERSTPTVSHGGEATLVPAVVDL